MRAKIGQWGYSLDDEETYFGSFDHQEEAVAAAQSKRMNGKSFLVGQYMAPRAPESFIEADDLIENILCQDEYCLECAEGTLEATTEQAEELTEALRKVFADWVDRHGLRPTFLLVDPETVVRHKPMPQPV